MKLLCPTFCDPVDCSLPGSSIHGIFQARILEWVAISFSRRSSWPRDWTLRCRQMLYCLSHQGSPGVIILSVWLTLILANLVNVMEKGMAPYSSTLAWKIPWTEEPGRRQSMGSHRVRRDWATSLSLFTFMHWRRKWQPTPVFLPGESQGWGSLVGCCLWGRTESDTIEVP